VVETQERQKALREKDRATMDAFMKMAKEKFGYTVGTGYDIDPVVVCTCGDPLARCLCYVFPSISVTEWRFPKLLAHPENTISIDLHLSTNERFLGAGDTTPLVGACFLA
jgi:hypothetical protein